MLRQTPLSLATAALFGALAISPFANAEMPDTLNWTAYGTGTSGHAQIMAIGQIIQQRSGTQFRVIPGENDILRMTPLKTGRVDLCACGIASYYGSEGVMMFAGPDWGPQPIRVISTSLASFGLGMAVAGDVDVETPADLKGKRVAYIRGDDALNKAAEAYLAFGGLGWDDVEKVVFPGYNSAFDGIISGRADAAITTTVTPAAQRLAASPRGIQWPQLARDNQAGWQRMEAVAPYFQPHEVTAGAGIPEDGYHSASYPYPIMVANADLEYDTAYGLIKTLVEDYDRYKDAAPGAAGYAVENQNMTWVIPFHEAVVDYYRQAGIWTEEMQAHQDQLLKRQQLLAEAWDRYTASAPDDEEAFRQGWLDARAEALEAAGMRPVF
ncbi:TRAP transporter solute receptor, TAXI family [Modicisalibacter ilicicola DSM 19980]|uniref:TRAP transporter solute receptor, TAXI family n=1 Tax=Modicisalibacter ilicicola DSM 19980 TaxID=1121942 RepID=A0A1M5EII8_9GAMM|nr:TAXI family TRAP transporter solute-binding subunit [Halomonas ilicicola]SHF79103.1 TRAP transporter solute receptor, TAXI family [Halomonas ilicicola DSM 19980]